MIRGIVVDGQDINAYVKRNGNICPLPECGGSVDGTGEMELIDGDEVSIGRKCDKCCATWDDFYQLADISEVTPG